MNSNRFFLLLSALFLMIINVAQAQHRGHGIRSLEITEELKTELSLTDEQVVQLEALQAETREKGRAIRAHENADPQTRRDHAHASHKDMRGQLAEILTEEQMEQLKAYRRAKMEERRALMEQVDKEGMRAEVKAYREANVKPVMDAQYAKLEALLSAEEQAQLADWRTQIAAEKAKLKAEREAARSARENEENTKPSTNGRRAGAKPNRRGSKGGRVLDQLPTVKAGLEEMVAKYDTQIAQLLAEVQPQAVQWKADTKAIRDKYIPEELRKDRPDRQPNEAQQAKREMGHKIKFLLRDTVNQD